MCVIEIVMVFFGKVVQVYCVKWHTTIALKHDDITIKTAWCTVGLIRGRISNDPTGFAVSKDKDAITSLTRCY